MLFLFTPTTIVQTLITNIASIYILYELQQLLFALGANSIYYSLQYYNALTIISCCFKI